MMRNAMIQWFMHTLPLYLSLHFMNILAWGWGLGGRRQLTSHRKVKRLYWIIRIGFHSFPFSILTRANSNQNSNLDCFRSFQYVNTIRYHFTLPHIKENRCLNKVIHQTTNNITLLPSFYSKIWVGFWFNQELMERTWSLMQNYTRVFQNSSALKRSEPFCIWITRTTVFI